MKTKISIWAIMICIALDSGASVYWVSTVDDMTNGAGPITIWNEVIGANEIASAADTGAIIYTIWNNFYSLAGGAKYEIKTLSQHRIDIQDSAWIPDGDISTKIGADHYLLGGQTYVAILKPTNNIIDPMAFGLRMQSYTQTGAQSQFVAIDESNTMQSIANYAAKAARPSKHLLQSPFVSGYTSYVQFPSGVVCMDDVEIPGSVYFRGAKVGSYAGTVFRQYSTGGGILKLMPDDDGNSNASVFEGIRFKSGSGTSNPNASQVYADDSAVGINSIYFFNCWFQTPERFAVTVVGDDWKFSDCTFDVAAYSFVRLGTPNRAAVNTMFNNCTYFDFADWCINAVNATGVQVIGGKAYASGGVDSGGTSQQGSFLNNWSNTNSVSSVQIDNVRINDVTQVAKSTKNNFRLRNCYGQNVGGDGMDVIQIGGGSEMYGYDITGNVFDVIGDCNGIDMTGTALKRSIVSKNTFVSVDGEGYRAFQISDSRNDDNDFSDNSGFFFNEPSAWVNFSQNKMTYRLATGIIDPPSIGSGTSYSTYESYSGARLGDIVVYNPTSASWPVPDGIIVNAYVSSSDTISIRYLNVSGSPINAAAHQWYITVLPRDN